MYNLYVEVLIFPIIWKDERTVEGKKYEVIITDGQINSDCYDKWSFDKFMYFCLESYCDNSGRMV